MAIALLLIITIGVTEFASRLPFTMMASRFLGVFPRAIRAIRNDRVSDHWKERALLKLAKLSLISSLYMGGAILGLVALFVGGTYVLHLLYPRLWGFAMSTEGIVLASGAAIVYLVMKAHAQSRLRRR
jgi:hypothetical protein